MNEKFKFQYSSPKDNLFTSEKECSPLTYLNIDEFNINSHNQFTKEDYNFKKNIDKLNQKLNAEQNKYITVKNDLEKTHENLLGIAIKQISVYVEETDKLNSRLKEKEDTLKIYKNKVDEVNRKDNAEKDINYYKNSIRILEKKILEKTSAEDKFKKENESFKRQLNFYKDKLKLDYLNPIKTIDFNNNNHIKNTPPGKNSKNILNNGKGGIHCTSKAEAYKINKRKKMHTISCNFFEGINKENSKKKNLRYSSMEFKRNKHQSNPSTPRYQDENSLGKIPLFTACSPNHININQKDNLRTEVDNLMRNNSFDNENNFKNVKLKLFIKKFNLCR